MPPPGASAPAFAAAVEPAYTQLAAGGRIFLAAATTAGETILPCLYKD